MADLPPPSLVGARERVIEELSSHFANDALTLDDLERRMERVYKAASLADLEAITADLRPLPPLPAASALPARRPASGLAPRGSGVDVARPVEQERGRLLAVMGETRRVGRWAVPRRLEAVAVMSDARIDFTQAVLPAGVVELRVNAVMSGFRIYVPEGMRVVNDAHAIMGSVRSAADELPPPGAGESTMPVIHLTGIAFMAEIKVVVRRRGQYYMDDDDD